MAGKRKEAVRKSLGSTGIRTGKNQVGIAYATVPNDVDRGNYIKDCFKTQRIMMRDEYGGSWKNVFVSKNLMNDIIFPDVSGEIGSCVVWVRVPKHNIPVVVGILDLKSAYNIVQQENQFRLQRRSKTANSVDLNASADDATFNISVTSTENGKGKLSINISNPDQTASIDVYVKGAIKVFADKKIELVSNEELLLDIVDDELNVKAKFRYKLGEGWELVDEYGNLLSFKDKKILVKEGTNGKLVSITDSAVFLGEDNATEAVVLGNKLVDVLNDLLTAIRQIIVVTPAGNSTLPLVNDTSFATIQAQLNSILSQIVKTK